MINGNWLSLLYFHCMKATFIGIIIWSVSLSASFAQDKDSAIISKLAMEIMSNTYAYENLRYLCKEIGPRLSGSENSLKAVQATANMIKPIKTITFKISEIIKTQLHHYPIHNQFRKRISIRI